MKTTETKILEAFNRLVCTGDFEQLTVNDIVMEAGVSRATFYRHFKDKYDVMNCNYSILLQEVLSRKNVRTMQDVFLLLLNAGKNSWTSLQSLFSTTGVNSLHDHISSYSYTAAVNIYTTGDVYGRASAFRVLSEAERIQMKIFCHGAALFFEEWVKGKYMLTETEGALAMYELLPESFRGELRRAV